MLVILFTYIFLISPQTYNGNITWQPNKKAHLIGLFSGMSAYYFETIKLIQELNYNKKNLCH